jgi:hypothetical protein
MYIVYTDPRFEYLNTRLDHGPEHVNSGPPRSRGLGISDSMVGDDVASHGTVQEACAARHLVPDLSSFAKALCDLSRYYGWRGTPVGLVLTADRADCVSPHDAPTYLK